MDFVTGAWRIWLKAVYFVFCFFFFNLKIFVDYNNGEWEAQGLTYLQTASLDRIEHKKFLQQVFTVCGHVERDAVLSS